MRDSIAHYKVISAIGAGGMGEVYLAEDTKLERQVALKVLLDEVAGDEERVKRFVQEAKAASALNHPNILTVHEIGEFENSRYIVTELIKGKTLRDRLRGEPMNLREVLDVAMQVAAALNAAHNAGIVHRDIKPENIMLRDDGIVKVLDFGLAKLTVTSVGPVDSEDATRAQVNTRPGVVMGTVLYMSPEQARGKETDARCDVWGLGVVMYEMLAGKTPFVGETANDSIASILKSEPPPLDESTPAELRRIVRKSLQKHTEERYQTVKDLLLDVKNLKRELEFSEELERSNVPNTTGSATVGTAQMSEHVTAIHSGAVSTQNSIPQQMSSAEYLVTQVKRGKFWILPLGVLLIAGIGFGIYKFSGGQKAEVSFESAKINRVTSSGKATIATISPDGKYIVHVVAEAGKQSLWVRQTLTGSNVQILPPAEISYWGITFSPDGNFVYYVARDVGKGVGLLYRVPVLGGTPVTLVNDVDSPITLSPDGSQMAFVRWANDGERLFVANIDGTAERELVKHDLESLKSGVAWSPDGKTLVYPLRNKETTSLLSVRVSDGVTTPLSQKSWDSVRQVTWFNDDTIILNARDLNSNSGMQLWSLSLSDGQAAPITRDLNSYRNVSLSADANTLVTVQSDEQSNVYLAQAGDEERLKQLTNGKGSDGTNVSWTTDGRVLYDSNHNGNADIFTMAADGTNQQQVTTDPKIDYRPVASGDGRYIAFSSDRAGTFEIWRMNVDGKNPLKLTTGVGDAWGSFTPDGKWFLYASGGNDSRIFKISIDGGEPEPVGDDTSVYVPVVSPDGQMIAYWHYVGVERGGNYLLNIMSSSGGPAVKAFELPPTALFKQQIQFSANGQSIFYLDTRNGVSNVWSQPINGDKPKQVTNFKSGRIMSFAYSPDGKQIAFTKGDTTNDVVMISGFRK